MKRFSKALAAMMLMTAVFFAAGCKPENGPNNDNSGGNGGGSTYDGPAYVNLGLPSGTLWATCNIGANAPEEYGDYFAWGETTPKTTYNWSTYKYCNGGEGWNTLTKYCNKSNYGYNGFTDDLTILQPSDDAATANRGDSWCMPTYDQWVELYQNTNSNWCARNGVNGRLFIAANGNSIFLPAAGGREGDELRYAGSKGHYWSSSFSADFPESAWIFNFTSGDYTMFDDAGREGGFSVRAVRSMRQN